jgi:import receptor subunit TOM70
MNDSIPPQPQLLPIIPDGSAFTTSASSSSLWDRISTWAAEHKAVVYTVAGVTLIATAAGVYYVVNDANNKGSKPSTPASSTTTGSKKKKRKNKKAAESSASTDAANQTASKAASVSTVDIESELGDITDDFVASLSEAVCDSLTSETLSLLTTE